MEIAINEITSVDKEIILKANREELQPQFDKAFKTYQAKMNLPGFRPGKAPLSLVKNRFGKEIEFEEINKFIQASFEKEIMPNHNTVGETQMTDLKWEDDKLEVTFKVGFPPEFDLKKLESLSVNKMVHDVTDAEVDEEIERSRERDGNWIEVEAPVEESSRVVADVVSLDANGNEVDGEKDIDQLIDLTQESAGDFRTALAGKKIGDVVDMDLKEGEDSDSFRVTIKKVMTLDKPELNEEFFKKQSREEASDLDSFKSFIKSQMQQYYDQTSNDLIKNNLVDALVDAHDFEVPEVFLAQVLNSYVDYAKQQSGGKLPQDFDEELFKENSKERALREAKWYFISLKLQDTFEDIEIKPEDIDAFIGAEATRFGVAPDQLKGYYAQNPSMLENLRNSIREQKLFDKLQQVVTIHEMSKDDYRSAIQKTEKPK